MRPESTSTTASLTQFWSEIATQYIDWIQPWNSICSGEFENGDVAWFRGGLLNVSVNCLDRHLPYKAQQPAIIWEGDEDNDQITLNFAQLHAEVCRMSNAFKQLGVKKGDVVGIYLPMIPEAAIAMLACARIGAVHTVVFAGFSSQSLKNRLVDSQCTFLVTANAYTRGGTLFLLKEQADSACIDLPIQCLIIKSHSVAVAFDKKKDHWWHEIRSSCSPQCDPEPMEAEDPLFILYTSGSTGQPKGLVHTTGGYLVQVAYTHQLVFGCNETDVFWCTADVGWITGHSYLVYGPLCNGITTLMYSGIPTWPNAGRYWQIIDRHRVTVLYTSPTAIRTLKRAGDDWLKHSSRTSLRLLGSVGEPINPEAWSWFHQKVGHKRCPIVDTWWQTETGSIMISPDITKVQKPGAAGQPIPGLVVTLLDEHDKELLGVAQGTLAIKYPWPAMARTILGDHRRYLQTYFSKGYYQTGDGAKRDAGGDYWITGRVDDVLNVSGHRLGTAEIESALASHASVAEAAVVGIPHDIKGQGIYAFICLKHDAHVDFTQLKQHVSEVLSPIAKPDVIQFVSDLPKTRSGKIMRRILRKIASQEVKTPEEFGDLSTLANPQIIEALFEHKST